MGHWCHITGVCQKLAWNTLEDYQLAVAAGNEVHVLDLRQVSTALHYA
jgi:hypothetical protein